MLLFQIWWKSQEALWKLSLTSFVCLAPKVFKVYKYYKHSVFLNIFRYPDYTRPTSQCSIDNHIFSWLLLPGTWLSLKHVLNILRISQHSISTSPFMWGTTLSPKFWKGEDHCFLVDSHINVLEGCIIVLQFKDFFVVIIISLHSLTVEILCLYMAIL